MKSESKVRIGIDVGGTFTHAVAIESDTMEMVGKVKVPTTHRAPEGVAKGIIEALAKLLSEAKLAPERVGFIAHSTTQATNALLEGDVAPVGIIAMGRGGDAWLARMVSNLGKLELAPDRYLSTCHTFIDTTRKPSQESIRSAVEELRRQGAQAFAVSEAFSVDDTGTEEYVVGIVRDMGVPATAGHEVSQLYGFKVRTRTAVINASMLPKMIESADMTEASVRSAGISAPVMIMRSDGGVMDIDAMRKRPILTMLSGPAAGVAAAMMFLHISDGIFLEVGGTSTDISAISNGRASIRSAEIGGHRVYMRTLDVRTVGVAGGSMPRAKNGKLFDIGPRSAHIAGLRYISFDEPMVKPEIKSVQPLEGDPADYIALQDVEAKSASASTGSASKDGAVSSQDGTSSTQSRATATSGATHCLTPTCASNLLLLVPPNDCATGDIKSIKTAFGAMGSFLNISSEQAATEMLSLAAAKCIKVVEALIADHKLDRELVTLVGGGGGAAAIVPFVAKQMDMKHKIAEHADVISAIGVALALIRETIERQIVNPSDDDVLRVRQEAHASVEKMGADPASIEVHIEIDTRTSVLRATACGASSMKTDARDMKSELTPEERRALVAESMRVVAQQVNLRVDGRFFQVFCAERMEPQLAGLWKRQLNSVRVLDRAGDIRLQFRNAALERAAPDSAERVISTLIEEHSEWGDAGKVIPDVVLLAGPRIIDLSGLLDASQVLALARAELETLPKDAEIVAIARLN